jgi:hypothetical protein
VKVPRFVERLLGKEERGGCTEEQLQVSRRLDNVRARLNALTTEADVITHRREGDGCGIRQ